MLRMKQQHETCECNGGSVDIEAGVGIEHFA